MRRSIRTAWLFATVAAFGSVAQAAADDICSFAVSTMTPVVEGQCATFSMPGSSFNVQRNYVVYGQLICSGGQPQLIYDTQTFEVTGRGTCYGLGGGANYIFGRCNPRWSENLNSSGHSWSLTVENADAFVLESFPVCFWPTYYEYSKTVGQRSCTQDPCPAPVPVPPPYEQWYQNQSCYDVYLVTDWYWCWDGCHYAYSEYEYLGWYCL